MNNHDETTAATGRRRLRAHARVDASSADTSGAGYPGPAPVDSSAREQFAALLRRAGEYAPAVVEGDLGCRLGIALEGLARQPGTGLLPYRLRRLAEAVLAAPLIDKAPQ
ncbi:hypothetical protein ACFQ05_11665 [Amycolatopsis umgeniensis]|uniref:Uncharacterized protein n=1 Tax=Amycolatopsis umgeniensis TaxID=336628 RepID=A0A841B1H0_9PSEU|nr:hypothetical protein [Amycolatopsis umgeniensis]MBB5853956.1 hypothetical protein [Amycolatopsis umgeniensis]